MSKWCISESRNYFSTDFKPNKWLKGIFFSKLDTQIGPRLMCQVPKDILSEEDFNKISNFVICQPIKHFKVVTFLHRNLYIIGCPIEIIDSNYPRNCFVFNTCFIVDSTISQDDLEISKSIVERTAFYLRLFEMKHNILSSDTWNLLSDTILIDIFNALIDNKPNCIVEYGGRSIFLLNLRPQFTKNYGQYKPLYWSDIPVLLHGPDVINKFYWDYTTTRLLLHINGINNLKQISIESMIDLPYVMLTINSLIHDYGFVATIPQYFLCSRFLPSFNFNEILNNESLKNKICDRSILSTHQKIYNTESSKDSYDVYGTVVHLLINLVNGCPINHLTKLLSKDESEHINIKSMIDFALLNNIIELRPLYKIQHCFYMGPIDNQQQHKYSVIPSPTKYPSISTATDNGTKQEVDPLIEIRQNNLFI